MRRKPNKVLDPMTQVMVSLQKIGWSFIAPCVDKERDACYGIIAGEDKWVDLVRSYLPADFAKRVEEVLKLPPIEKKIEEPKNE